MHRRLAQQLLPDRDTQQQAKPVAEISTLSEALHAAISAGYRATYGLIFGRQWVEDLAHHHVQTIRWHWAARHRICRDQEPFRGYYADFPMWSRGHAKSTIAKYIAVIDAMIELYYGRTGYCLYFSGTDNKTEKHAKSVHMLLQSFAVRTHAPMLTQVKRSDEGSKSMGWKATFLYTGSGHVFHFGSLQSGLAGGNVDDVRPTMLIPDDIDDRKNSPVMAEKNFNLFTTEILPMGAMGRTLTLWAQNLINRYSAMYRIYKGHARVLTDRRPSRPVPAILGLETELRAVTVRGQTIVRDVIIAGTPTWQFFSLKNCQHEMNRFGLPSFLAECQHEVEGTREKAMLHMYNDKVHVISVSEFESVFGERKMPAEWIKEWGNDWARTKTKYHANVALWRTVSSRSSAKPGLQFYFNPMSFKANAQAEDVAERALSCLEKYAIKREPPAESVTWAELRNDELVRANALEHTTTQLDRIEFERAALKEVIPPYAAATLAEHNVVGGVNSHEREDIRMIFNDIYGMNVAGINPGKFGGVEQANRDFAIDMKTEHPFRPGVYGFSRTFIVVPDDESQTPTVINNVAVYPPKPYPEALAPDDLHDDDLMRYQLVNWEVMEPKLIESGERVDDPVKANDDFGNLIQMFEYNGGLQNPAQTPMEEVELLIPQSARPKPQADGTYNITKSDALNFNFAQHFAIEQVKEKHGDDVFDLDDDPEYNWES